MVPRLPISISRDFWTMPASIKPGRARWRLILLSLSLFVLNAWICRELFSIEFIRNLDSNEGVFVSISRFFRERGLTESWFPWFNAGMPIANAYQPLLPMLAALTGKLTGWSVEHAFHFVLAMAYCCGPVALFWFAWDWSESAVLSLTASLAFSLWSPAELLIPVLRVNSDGHWGALRLFNLIHYAEDPHNVALSLLPVALLFLRRAMANRTPLNLAGAIASSAAVVLTNAFGAADLAIGGLCIALALRRGLRTLFLTGFAVALWISPWLPPSLIHLILQDQWGARGFLHTTLRSYLTVAAVAATFLGLWALSRWLRSPIDRFAILFAFWMCLIPLGYFFLDLTIVPQGSRYQLELELAVCLVFGCLCAHLPWRTVVVAVLGVILLAAGIRQAVLFRHYARGLIQPVDIAQTIEYKTIMWLDRNLPGQRALVSGDTEYLYNIFSNNPQLSAGHEPTAPNWMQRVAVYTIYTGINAGDRDAEYSVFWLKAFGNQAVTVPGPKSREFYHPIVHPRKFDGVLPVLWHDEDDTIFAVPQRSRSLAHVVPREAIATRSPMHGLDIDPVRAYVAALDDASLPLADLVWQSPSHGVIRAIMKPGQVLSVQVSYVPGWRARVQGREVPVHKDAIGLIVAEPACNGPCDVDLKFGPTREAWICRILSALVTLSLWLLILLRVAAPGIFATTRTEPLPPR
jgi:hypothetical protein